MLSPELHMSCHGQKVLTVFFFFLSQDIDNSSDVQSIPTKILQATVNYCSLKRCLESASYII